MSQWCSETLRLPGLVSQVAPCWSFGKPEAVIAHVLPGAHRALKKDWCVLRSVHAGIPLLSAMMGWQALLGSRPEAQFRLSTALASRWAEVAM